MYVKVVHKTDLPSSGKKNTYTPSGHMACSSGKNYVFISCRGLQPEGNSRISFVRHSVRPSVRPSVRNKMCPRRFLSNCLADFYEFWHAISLILLVDAQHFKYFFCLIFQTLFRHFRPPFPAAKWLITDSTFLQWADQAQLECIVFKSHSFHFLILLLIFYSV